MRESDNSISRSKAAGGEWQSSIREKKRFAFGRNWQRFFDHLDDKRIDTACASLREMLRRQDLNGLRLLDIGSGSGLFSLAARRMGATVHSFDFDPFSVACTTALRNRYCPQDDSWRIEEGSVLDPAYLESLGQFDIVYSWGVLHHTGRMYEALENAGRRVAPGGELFIAIYNDQGWISRYWTLVKRLYNRNWLTRWIVVAAHVPYLVVARVAVRAMTGRFSIERGMAYWTDAIDWLGGYPFEVGSPEKIFRFFRDRGFSLTELKTCRGRMGCNEFVFSNSAARTSLRDS